MRLGKHVNIIKSQLENVQDLTTQFEGLVLDTSQIIIQGQSWIDETETTLTFTEINKLLTCETENCIQKCLNIANEDKSHTIPKCKESKPGVLCTLPPAKSDENVTAMNIKLDEMDKLISKQSTELRDLKQRIKHHDKHIELMAGECKEKQRDSEKQFEDIMKEFHLASNFMTNVQSQIDMVTNEVNDHEKSLDSVRRELRDQDKNILMLKVNQESENHSIYDEMKKQFENVKETFQKQVENVNETFQKQVENVNETFQKQVEKQSYNENLNREITVTLNALQQKLDDQGEKIKVITINQKSEGEKLCVIENKMGKNINSLRGTVGRLERNIQTVLSEVNKSKTSCDQLWKVSVDNKSYNENLNREITLTLNALQQKLDDQEEKIKVITINQKSEGEKLCVIENKMENNINSLKGTVGRLERNIQTVLSEVNKSKTSCDQLWKVSVDNKLVMVSSEVEGMSKYIAELKICNTKKIYFSVGINSKKVVPKNDIVKYDTVFTNIGNGYNILTGIFTCPMEGIYVFLVGVLSDRNKYVGLDLYQNMDYKMSVFARENNGYCSTGNSVILHLKLGDQVYLKAKDSSDLYGKPLDIVNTFSGCLSAADEAT